MAHFIQTGPYSLHCFFLLLEFNRVLDNGIIIKDLRCHSHVSVSSSQIKTTGKQTSDLFFGVRLCRHLSSDSRGTKPLFWRARDALGQDKQKVHMLKMVIFLCLSSLPLRLLLTSIAGFFVPREWLAAKGLVSL